jgi:hypothetical protein
MKPLVLRIFFICVYLVLALVAKPASGAEESDNLNIVRVGMDYDEVRKLFPGVTPTNPLCQQAFESACDLEVKRYKIARWEMDIRFIFNKQRKLNHLVINYPVFVPFQRNDLAEMDVEIVYEYFVKRYSHIFKDGKQTQDRENRKYLMYCDQVVKKIYGKQPLELGDSPWLIKRTIIGLEIIRADQKWSIDYSVQNGEACANLPDSVKRDVYRGLEPSWTMQLSAKKRE